MGRYTIDDGSIKVVLDKVITQYYSDLLNTKFKLVFDMKEIPTKLGSIRRVSEREKCSGIDADLMLIVAGVWWNKTENASKEALIDHELAHVEYVIKEDGSKQYKMRKHDIEEFLSVVERHGAWTIQLHMFNEVLRKGIDEKIANVAKGLN